MAQNTLWRLSYTAQQLSDAATNQVPQISGATGNWECWDITTSAWVDTGVPAAGKNPYIGSDHYWYVWDAVQNQYVKTSYSVAQDAVQSVNGVFADAGGNVALGWSNISGANPLTKGGTGKTTAPSGLRALISACSALTNSGVASGDYVPLQDASDSTNAKKITLENLTTYIGANIPYGAKIQTGSYIGTGVYGSGNPNSITFNFAPKVVWCGDSVLRATTYSGDSGADMHYIGMLLTSLLTTSYKKDYGFGYSPGNLGTNAGIFGRISNDDKTIYWYNTIGPENQYNQSNKTYYWLAIV